jgi:hypothetical protein
VVFQFRVVWGTNYYRHKQISTLDLRQVTTYGTQKKDTKFTRNVCIHRRATKIRGNRKKYLVQNVGSGHDNIKMYLT